MVAVLTLLSGRLSEATMRNLNRRVEVDGEDVSAVAASALTDLGVRSPSGEVPSSGSGGVSAAPATAGSQSLGSYLWMRRALLLRLTLDHPWLVALALGGAALVAIPLALARERARRSAGPVLGALGVLQTIPSIALLAFMVPLLGIGVLPAVIALWLYALYPIAPGTYAGVRDADPAAVEAAEALGMTAGQRLLQVRLSAGGAGHHGRCAHRGGDHGGGGNAGRVHRGGRPW